MVKSLKNEKEKIKMKNKMEIITQHGEFPTTKVMEN
jgi:hypothetical protein